VIFLKKLGLIILLLFSLQLFGEGYEVKKSKKVTLSEQQISQENREIEAGLKNVVKETFKGVFSSFANVIEFGFENEMDTKNMTKKEKEDVKKVTKIMVENYAKIFALVAETTEIKINKNLPVSDYDMSIILGNLIDNAMDAQMKINEDNRKINIKIVDEKNKFTITINNIFNGEIKEKNGILISKKEDSSSHGLGLNSVKEYVEKYDGIFKINYNDKKFTSYVMFIKDKN